MRMEKFSRGPIMDDSFRNGCCSKIDVASSIVIFLFALLLVSGMMVRQILG